MAMADLSTVGKGKAVASPFAWVAGRPATFCKNHACPGTPQGQVAMVFADHAVRQTHCRYCHARFKYPDEQYMHMSIGRSPAQDFGYTGPQHFSPVAFQHKGGKGKGQGSKDTGKGKPSGKGKGAKGLGRKQAKGWPSNHFKGEKGKGTGNDSSKHSGNNSRDQGGPPTVDLDQLLQECERQGVNPMDKDERLKIERQLKTGPAQAFGDAQSAFQAAVKRRNHAKKVANDIANSLARLMQQAKQKQELLITACDELAAAEARVAAEHVELGKLLGSPLSNKTKIYPH